MHNQFGQLLRMYRHRCSEIEPGKRFTQAQMAEQLEETAGIRYTLATISNWELGKCQIHQDDRQILIGIIKVFYDYGVLQTLKDANNFLESGNYRPLDVHEQHQIDPDWNKTNLSLTTEPHPQHTFALPLDTIPNSGSLPASSRVPLRVNPFFVGREQILEQLARLFSDDDSAVTVALTGLGGIGKTQLAVEFCHRYGQFFPGGVFWLSFADPDCISTEIAACGSIDCLNVSPQVNDLSLSEQVKLVQRAWCDPVPRLLVFDNCKDGDLLAKWRPTIGGCRILVTSRCGYWDPILSVKTVPLDVLNRHESAALLRKFSPIIDDSGANALAVELGDLPLAIHLAGHFLARYAHVITPSVYLTQLRSGDLLQHPSLTGHGAGYIPTAHDGHVGRTFALSYKQLDLGVQADRLAQQLLARAACLSPGEPIPRDFLLSTLPQTSSDANAVLLAEDGLMRLLTLGLLEERAAGTLWLHRLVAHFAKDVSNMDAQVAVESTLIHILSQQLQENGYLNQQSSLITHLRTVTHAAQSRNDKGTADLCHLLAIHLRDMGHYTAALPYAERALAIRESVLGYNHANTAHICNDLGWLLYRVGHLVDARQYLERALTVQEHVLEPEHLHTAQSLYNLGWLLWKEGDFVQAQQLFVRSLAIRQRKLGYDHPDTAASLNGLAGLLWSQGNYTDAQPILEQALTITERHRGHHHLDTAHCLNNLGLLLVKRGDCDRARPLLERALAIREQILGADHPSVAYSLNNLATLLQAEGDYTKARIYLEQALTIQIHKLGPNHPHTAYTLHTLGMIHHDIGALLSAQQYLEQALLIREQQLGTEHPDTAMTLRDLGVLQQARGDATKAQTFFQHALAIFKKSYGVDHPQTIETQQKLQQVVFSSSLGAAPTLMNNNPLFEKYVKPTCTSAKYGAA